MPKLGFGSSSDPEFRFALSCFEREVWGNTVKQRLLFAVKSEGVTSIHTCWNIGFEVANQRMDDNSLFPLVFFARCFLCSVWLGISCVDSSNSGLKNEPIGRLESINMDEGRRGEGSTVHPRECADAATQHTDFTTHCVYSLKPTGRHSQKTVFWITSSPF